MQNRLKFGVVFFGAMLSGHWLSSCSQPTPKHQDQQPEQSVRVSVSNEFSLETLSAYGFYPDHGHQPNRFDGYVKAIDLNVFEEKFSGHYEMAPSPRITAEMREGYHNYNELTAELESLVANNDQIMRLETAGESIQGRELWYVVVSDHVASLEAEPKFIYHANMHGDEVVGRELMIYLLREIADKYGTDPRITQIVDNSQLYVMPSMNPDGFELGRRGNARGYDLNRNFPDRFTSPEDTPDGRQKEVQHMINLVHGHHFIYGINWHGGELCFNLPWGNIANNRPERMYWDDQMFNPIGREYTEINQPMYENHRANFDHGLTYGYEWYPVNGGINDWFNYFQRSVHSVVELSVNKWPSSRYLARYWDDNREAMITYLWRGLRGIHSVVSDPSGNLISPVFVSLESAPGRRMRFDDGHVFRLSGAGPQTITFAAEGFRPKTITIEAKYFDGSLTPVSLELN